MLAILALLLAADPVTTDAVRTQPRFKIGAYAVHYCEAADLEKRALAEIKKEKEDARIAGVVDLASLKEEQDKVVNQREWQRIYLVELRRLGARTPACGDKLVRWLRACAESDEADGCDGEEMEAFRQLVSDTKIWDPAEWKRQNGEN